MRQILSDNYFKNILIVSAGAFLMLQIGIIYVVQPAFKQKLTQNTEDEALRVATYLMATIVPVQAPLPEQFTDNAKLDVISGVVKDFQLMKLKIFSDVGKIIYSTDPKDVGTLNQKIYFHEKVARGQHYTKVINKNDRTLEDQIASADVVETYIPIMRDNMFGGAFEIYYDITDRKKKFDHLLSGLSIILILISILLFGPVYLILKGTAKHISKAQQEEAEKKRLLAEMHKTLADAKTLSGLLAICSNCKKIRDDQGQWNQIETYIRKHTLVDFSHGICPDCAKKLYANLLKDN